MALLQESGLTVSTLYVSTPDPLTNDVSNGHLAEVDYRAIPASWYILIGNVQSTYYPEKYIVWQIEQLSSAHFTDDYLRLLDKASYVWHFASCSVRLIQTDAFFAKSWVVPFLYTRLPEVSVSAYKCYKDGGSILFYGALNERRRVILQRLKTIYGDRLHIKTVFGETLYEEIRNAAVVINLHYYSKASLEMARFNEVLQCRVPIVSECGVETDAYCSSQYSRDTVRFVPVIGTDLSNIDTLRRTIDEVLQEGKAVSATALQPVERHSRQALHRALIPLKFKLNTYPYRLHLHQSLFYCLHLPETPFRYEAFHQQPNIPTSTTYEVIQGVKASPGWKGCGWSYYNIIWNAKRCKLPYVVIFEDDCEFPEHFNTMYATVIQFLNTRSGWNIFNGCIASLPPDTKIEDLSCFGGLQFVQVDKMHSMVFNIYHQSVYDKILNWDIHTPSPTNQIDQFIKNIPNLKIITTHPFLFRCLDVKSTLWGKNLYDEYNYLFRNSHLLIEKAIGEQMAASSAEREQNRLPTRAFVLLMGGEMARDGHVPRTHALFYKWLRLQHNMTVDVCIISSEDNVHNFVTHYTPSDDDNIQSVCVLRHTDGEERTNLVKHVFSRIQRHRKKYYLFILQEDTTDFITNSFLNSLTLPTDEFKTLTQDYNVENIPVRNQIVVEDCLFVALSDDHLDHLFMDSY